MILYTADLSHREIVALRSKGAISFGGHRKNKIYGALECKGAKRWIAKGHYIKNRVFFSSEEEAISSGYRPCANCMPVKYKAWKNQVR